MRLQPPCFYVILIGITMITKRFPKWNGHYHTLLQIKTKLPPSAPSSAMPHRTQTEPWADLPEWDSILAEHTASDRRHPDTLSPGRTRFLRYSSGQSSDRYSIWRRRSHNTQQSRRNACPPVPGTPWKYAGKRPRVPVCLARRTYRVPCREPLRPRHHRSSADRLT